MESYLNGSSLRADGTCPTAGSVATSTVPKRDFGHDDHVDVVEFRRTGGGLNERAAVVINGVELTRLWQQATRRGSSPLFVSEVGGSLELWGPDGGVPPSPFLVEWVPEGSAPVLTCSCGDFGCGGALIQISFERRRLVTWRDFRTANYEEPVDLGAFTFDRTQYEEARRGF